jgi:hypothetical protein
MYSMSFPSAEPLDRWMSSVGPHTSLVRGGKSLSFLTSCSSKAVAADARVTHVHDVAEHPQVVAPSGFQRSQATPRPFSSSTSPRKAPTSLHLPGSASVGPGAGAGQSETPRRRSSGSPVPLGSGSKAGPFARYFSRSSAQVQSAKHG